MCELYKTHTYVSCAIPIEALELYRPKLWATFKKKLASF